ncbi:MAG TPA: hypothetical protein VMU06_18550 [Stellaceae bacterium]|nr:hypothetical protein [Stellaceae bacterium]
MDQYVAIDPLALLLRPDIYIRLHLPDPPPPDIWIAQVRAIVKTMTSAERQAALTRAKALGTYANALAKEIAPG